MRKAVGKAITPCLQEAELSGTEEIRQQNLWQSQVLEGIPQLLKVNCRAAWCPQCFFSTDICVAAAKSEIQLSEFSTGETAVLSWAPLDLYHVRWEQSFALKSVVYVIYGMYYQ